MDGASLVDKESLAKIFRKCFSLKTDEDVNELLELFDEDPVSISFVHLFLNSWINTVNF